MIQSILLAFSMFSRLPVPKVEWNEKNMRYLLAAFPLVGLVVGVFIAAWIWVCALVRCGPLLRGAGFAILPLLLTGGIHMDGFCDVTDALASHGDIETKRRILKDPHIGSFAAIALGAYLLVFFALAAETVFSGDRLTCIVLLFVLSRALGGLAVLLFPCSTTSSLGKSFQSAANKKTSIVFLAVCVLFIGGAFVILDGRIGLAAFLLSVAAFAWCGRTAAKHFGGMNGDLSGWLVQTSELLSLACLAIVPLF